MKNDKRKQRPKPIGSVSHGTHRPQDLIEACCDAHRLYKGQIPRLIWNAVLRANAQAQTETEQWEREQYAIELLTSALEAIELPCMYFGAHIGNGSDFGFWVSDDAITWAIDDCELLSVSDLADIPAKYKGYAVVVNDHGNQSLYRCNGRGKQTNIWSVV